MKGFFRMADDRHLIASIAAHTRWANCDDPAAQTASARKEFLNRFERDVDPNGTLTPEERARRATHARKAYFRRLALKSARVRRTKAGDRTGSGSGEAA